MTVLVAYGSRNGSTAEIADTIGVALRAEGIQVAIRPAEEVTDLTDYDAVVIGGALYTGRWHRAAREFVLRHAEALTGMPVWMFSSGPLDDSAERHNIRPVAQVAALMHRIEARGHVTFGGRLGDDAHGFIARAMAHHGSIGDFRDERHIASWSRAIAAELTRAGSATG